MTCAITAPGPRTGEEERQTDDHGEDQEPDEAVRERREGVGDQVTEARGGDDADEHGHEGHERQNVPDDRVYGLAPALEQDPDDPAHAAPETGYEAGEPAAHLAALAAPGARAWSGWRPNGLAS